MRIQIVGKVHRSGVSAKSGKSYDFVEIHFTAPARGVEGEAAQTVTMDPGIYPFEKIGRGHYEMDFDNHGVPLSLTPIQQPTASK